MGAAPGRRLRQVHHFLGHIGMRPGLDAAQNFRPLLALHLMAEYRLHVLGRIGRLDDQVVEMLFDIRQRRLLAAPPGRHRGHQQFLAEQALADGRQEAHQGAGTEQAAAQCVGDDHPAGARHVEQAGHAERRFAAQFERVAIAVVLAAQDDVHPLQAAQGFQVHRVAAHRQILPFDQRVAEVARQVGMLEIGFVVRPRRQQHDMRRLVALDRGERRQALLLVAEEIGDMLDAQVAEHFREDARHDEAVFQRIAGARGGLRAVGDHPPVAVGRPGQIDGVVVQPDIARRLDAVAGPQVAVLAIDQRRRQQTLGEQGLRPVEVGQHGVEHGGALGDRHRHLGPLLRRDDQRHRVQGPRPVGPIGRGIDVVGDAVFQDAPVDEFQALAHFVRRHRVEMVEELLPVRTYAAIRRQHFVVAVGAVGIDGEEGAGHGALSGALGPQSNHPRPECAPGAIILGQKRRKSSVNGCSALSSTGLTPTLPGVCPKRKKRARRRLSAS